MKKNDSSSIPQLKRWLMQFWKLWSNSCSRRWLRRSGAIGLILSNRQKNFLEWVYYKSFMKLYFIKVVLDNRFCDLRRSPIVLFILVVTIFRSFSNVNFEPSKMPKCFWYMDWVTFALLSTKEGWGSFFVLRLKMIS